MVNVVDQETVEDVTDEDIKLVSINSVQFNKNLSILTAKLKTSGQNSVIVPYKIDTGSDRNIMPEHIFKIVFPEVMKEQLAATKNKYVILKTYNKTTVSQLCMCTVLIEYKSNKKRCKFFIVPGNGLTLLGMPETDVLNIIDINIHSIGVEDAGEGMCCANTHTHTVWGSTQTWEVQ